MENTLIILDNDIKEAVENYDISLLCYYEGCGADDGWPEFSLKY